jgi:Na+/alanine symporter
MRTLIAHAVGFSVGILVVIIFSTVIYGSVEARPIWTTYVFSQGGMAVPNPIGIVVLIFVIISLVKSSALKQQIAELQENE